MSGDPEPVAPGVWSVRVPLGVAHNHSALCYLIKDPAGGIHMVDGGLGTPESVGLVRAALDAVGGKLRTLTLTHFHGDHMGFAPEASAAGARIGIHRLDADALVAGDRGADAAELERWGTPPAAARELLDLRYSPLPAGPVDDLLEDGGRLDIPGLDARVVHTPGHTDGSICVVLPDAGLIFTGDHVLPDQFPGIGVGGRPLTNPIEDYRTALHRVLEYDGYTVLPGHGWVFDTLGRRVEETLGRHSRRTDEVTRVLGEDPDSTTWEVASQLSWSAGWDGLIGFYRLSALRQTQWHMDLVRAR